MNAMIAKEEPAEIQGCPIAEVTTFDHDGFCLQCPVCSYEYSHIRSAYTALGNDPHEGGAAYLGTEARGVTPYRRDCLVITVAGECEHVWEIRIQQNKGINYVFTRVIE